VDEPLIDNWLVPAVTKPHGAKAAVRCNGETALYLLDGIGVRHAHGDPAVEMMTRAVAFRWPSSINTYDNLPRLIVLPRGALSALAAFCFVGDLLAQPVIPCLLLGAEVIVLLLALPAPNIVAPPL
jgi:hypothetical protein